eukprot:3831854-Pyramimonas_sp.AAC.1
MGLWFPPPSSLPPPPPLLLAPSISHHPSSRLFPSGSMLFLSWAPRLKWLSTEALMPRSRRAGASSGSRVSWVCLGPPRVWHGLPHEFPGPPWPEFPH